jgi:hypothetical protein
MKIFYLFPRSGNAVGLPLAVTWRRNVLSALQHLGHDVEEYYEPVLEQLAGAEGQDPSWLRENQQSFVGRVLDSLKSCNQQKPVDLFLSYVWEPLFTTEALREIRRLSIPTVNFFCNYYNGFNRIKALAPLFDCNWVSDRGALPLYQRIGAHAVFVPMAANPDVYHPHPVARQFPVTFVGGKYGTRADYIFYLLQQSLPVRVWGPGWLPGHGRRTQVWTHVRTLVGRLPQRLSSRGGIQFLLRRLQDELHARFSRQRALREHELTRIAGPPLDDDEMIQMYSRSQISLGFSIVGNSHLENMPLTQIRLRDFEAPMSGALYLTEYSEGIEELYELDREIAVFRTKEELADKVRFYLGHPAEAQKVRTAGRERALRQHTWQQRFRDLFNQVGLASNLRNAVSRAQ